MRKYETVIVVSGDTAEEKHSELITKISETISKNDGHLLKIEDWGKKTLAFEVKKQNKGVYTLFEYAGVGNLVAPIERLCRINEDVLLFGSFKVADEVDEQELSSATDQLAAYHEGRKARAAAAETEEGELPAGPYMRTETPADESTDESTDEQTDSEYGEDTDETSEPAAEEQTEDQSEQSQESEDPDDSDEEKSE